MKINLKCLSAKVLLGIIVLGIISCGSETDCCSIIDTNINILYKNELGENLINSNTDFDEANIKVYYKNGNEFEYVYNGNLDSPKMYRIDEDKNGNSILTIYPSNYYEGTQSTTLVALNQNIVDTLVCEFELSSNSEICKRAWLNGVEMNNRFLEGER